MGSGGIQTDPDKVEAIEGLTAPTDISGVRRIIGMAGWYSSLIPSYTEVVAPLTKLLKKGERFQWGDEQKIAFQAIKEKMKMAPILACPDYNKPFFLQTDAIATLDWVQCYSNANATRKTASHTEVDHSVHTRKITPPRKKSAWQ